MKDIDRVLSVSWRPCGNRVASVNMSRNYDVSLWDLKKEYNDRVVGIKEHTMHMTSVAWSSDENRLVSGSHDTTVRVWDTKRRDCKKVLLGHTLSVMSVAWSPDGKMVASGSYDNTLRIWDVESEECKKVMEGGADWVSSVAWSPNGKWVVSSGDTTVRLWDVESGECNKVMEGHTNRVISVAWSPDGKKIVSGSDDKTMRVWDVESRECTKVLYGHTGAVMSVSFLPKMSVTFLPLRSMWAFRQSRRFDGHVLEKIRTFLLPRTQKLASCGYDKTIRIWEFNDVEYSKKKRDRDEAGKGAGMTKRMKKE